jgi:hypothetical protein
MGRNAGRIPASISAEEQARRRKLVSDQGGAVDSLGVDSCCLVLVHLLDPERHLGSKGPPSSCWFQ